MEQFNSLEILSRNRFQITMSSDPRACYVALNMKGLLPDVDAGFSLSTEDMEQFSKDLLEHLIHPLCDFLGLALTERMSIGFPLCSVNPVFDSIRFTIGLEPQQQLQAYAEMLAYVAFVLNRQREAELFFQPLIGPLNRNEKPIYSLRKLYFAEKVEQFKAMTPGRNIRYNMYFAYPISNGQYLGVNVVLGNGIVQLTTHGHGLFYDCTIDNIFAPVRGQKNHVALSAMDVNLRRLCIACLTQYAVFGMDMHQNVKLTFLNNSFGRTGLDLTSLEMLGAWNDICTYGSFLVEQTNRKIYCNYSPRY